ncbi:MAG: hypothetical protein JSS49_29765 [Planctomycetes bacterium]|nr:hypothetical protein [Planctomycetota bacterium]
MRAFIPFTVAGLLATFVGLSIVASTVRSAANDDFEPSERIILMQTGRVLKGVASRNAGGWLVEQANGRIQVPLDQVTLVATSLADAYRKQRDSIVEPTPATHMSLAQWCISYRLHDEARDELKKCLRLDPDHSAARKLLYRLDESLDPATVKKPAPIDRNSLRTPDGFMVPDAESLGGLSSEAAVTFTQRIQPLLVNKCGNTSCHGTIKSGERSEGFHLTPVRIGTTAHRLYTERNLAEVMRYIDLKDPGQSPLMILPQGTHAGTAGVFHGTSGHTQIKMLRSWIKTVADEKRAEEEEFAVRPSIVAKARQAFAEVQAANPEWPEDNQEKIPRKLPANPAATPLSGNPLKGPGDSQPESADRNVLQASARQTDDSHATSKETYRDDEHSTDPFDPDIFNRRFHSSPRR